MVIKEIPDIHYTVERCGSDRWEVNKRGFNKAIASFSDKNDAVDYARSLAEMELKEPATVSVRD